MLVGGHAPVACPDKWSSPVPSGMLLQSPQVDAAQSDRTQQYALEEPQAGEVRVYLAENLLNAPTLARSLMELPPRLRVSIDIVMLDPQPDPDEVVRAANRLAVPIRVPSSRASVLDPEVFEFVDGFGPTLRPFATAALVLPMDTLEEWAGTDRVAERLGVLPGTEPETYAIGDGWVLQAFDWGVWVRPSTVAAAVADEVRRTFGEPAGGPLLVLFGVRDSIVPDAVLRRVYGLRKRLATFADWPRLRWLGKRAPRPAGTAATVAASAVHLDPGQRSGLDSAAGQQLAWHLADVGARALVVHALAGQVVFEDRLYDEAGLAGIVPPAVAGGPLLLASALGEQSRLTPDYAARFAVLRGADVIEVAGLGFGGSGGTVSANPPAGGLPLVLAVQEGMTAIRYRADGDTPQPLSPDLLNAFVAADLTPHRPAEPPVRPVVDAVDPLDVVASAVGVPPGLLLPIADRLATAAAGSRATDAGTLLAGLRAELREFGVHTDLDLVWLLTLADRHGLGTAGLPALSSLIARGAPLELLADLPHDAVQRLLDREGVAPPGGSALRDDPGFVATVLGLLPAGRHRHMLLARTFPTLTGEQIDRTVLSSLGAGAAADAALELDPETAALAAWTGRVPADLPTLAHLAGTTPAVLLSVAAALQTDPRHLLPFRALLRRVGSAVLPHGIALGDVVVALRTLAETAAGPAGADVPTFFWLIASAGLDGPDEEQFLTRLRHAAAALRSGLWPAPLGDVLHALAGMDATTAPLGDPFGGDLYSGLRQQWWSARLAVPVEELADLRVDLDALVAMAATLPAGPGPLVRFVQMTGRIPVELPGLVQRWGVGVEGLLDAAVTWNVEPAALAPMRHPSELLDRNTNMWMEWFFGGDRGSALALLTDLDLTFDDAWSLRHSGDLADRWWEWLWGPDRIQTVNAVRWPALAQHLRSFAADAFAAQGNDPQVLHQLAAQAGVSPTLFAMYSLSTGRVPHDLFDLAAAASVQPARLLALASLLGVDIRSLTGTGQLAGLFNGNDVSRRHAVEAVAGIGVAHSSGLPKPESQLMDDLAVTIAGRGRVPTDLFGLADELGISPAVLLGVSADFDADPRVIARTFPQLGTGFERSRAAVVERYAQWAAERGLAPAELKPFFAWLHEPDQVGRLPSELGALVDEWILAALPSGGLDDTLDEMRTRLRGVGTDLHTVRSMAKRWGAGLGALYAVTVGIGRLPIEVPELAAARGHPTGLLVDLMHVTRQHPLAVRGLLTAVAIPPHSVEATPQEFAAQTGRYWQQRLLALGKPAGLTAVELREILADLGADLNQAGTTGELGELQRNWVSLVLGGDHGSEYPQLFGSLRPLRDLVDWRVGQAGLDRLWIERLARSSGLSGTLVAAFSLRIGRVPVELAEWARLGTAGDGRLLLLAVLLGIDPGGPAEAELRQLLDVAPVGGGREMRGPVGVARAALAQRGDDPEWRQRHPPESAFGADLMAIIRLARGLELEPDEVVLFFSWLARGGQGPADLADVDADVLRPMRREWLAAEFNVAPSDIAEDQARHRWLRHTQALSLAGRLRVPPAEVRRWSLRFRQVPVDLAEQAQRLRLPEPVLWHLITNLEIDPWALEPVLAGRAKPGLPVDQDELVAAVRADLEGSSAAFGVPVGIVLPFLLDTAQATFGPHASGTTRVTRDDLDAWAGMLLGRRGTDDTHALNRPVTAADLEPLSWFAEAFDQDGDLTRAARQIVVSPLWLVLTSVRVGKLLLDLPARAAKYRMPSTRQLLALMSAHGSDLSSRPDNPVVLNRYRQLPQTGFPYREAWTLAQTLNARHGANGGLSPHAAMLGPFVDSVLSNGGDHDTSVRLADRIVTAQRAMLASPWSGGETDGRLDWLTPRAVEPLATRLGADPLMIWEFAVSFWRLPRDLDDLTTARELHGRDLYRIADALNVAPYHLSPVLKVYDPQRPLDTQLQEWTRRLRSWSDMGDESMLMLALHGLDLSLDWDGSVDALRDMVHDWLAVTLGVDRTTFRGAGRVDLRELWDVVRQLAEQIGGDGGQPRDLERLAMAAGVPVVWLRGVQVRTRMSPADIVDAVSGGASVTPLLALAAELGRPPARISLTPEQSARLVIHPVAGWWPAVKEIAAELRAGTAAPAPAGGPVAEAEAFIELLRAGVAVRQARIAQLVAHLRDYRIPLLDLPVEIRSGYVRHWNVWQVNASTGTREATELMTLLLARVAGDWSLPAGSDGQTQGVAAPAPVRVVHADPGGPAGRTGPAEGSLYLRLTLPGPQLIKSAPQGTRFSRAVDFDRHLGAPSDGIRLGDGGGMFLEDLLAAYRHRGGFVRFRGPDGGSGRGFDGVVRHISGQRYGRGIVLYRETGAAGSTTGVLNVYRGPSDEVVFLDALTFTPARLPAADVVDVLFLDTTPQPLSLRGADPADPREAWDWQDQLSDWAAELGISRADAYRIASDIGVQSGWVGDFNTVKDRWDTTVLGLTPDLYRTLKALPAAEQDHLRRNLRHLAGENGWTAQQVSEAATALGISPEWLRGALLLTGAQPIDLNNFEDRQDAHLRRAELAVAVELRRAPADLPLTDDQIKRLSTPDPAGWFAAVTQTAEQLRFAGSTPISKANTQVFHLIPLHSLDRFVDESVDGTDEYLDVLVEARDRANAESVDFATLSQDVLRAYLQFVSHQDVTRLAGAVLREAADGWRLPGGKDVRVVHAGSAGPAIALVLGQLELPRPGGDGLPEVPAGSEPAEALVARALAVDAWRRSPASGRQHFQTRKLSLGALVGHYPHSGGFVRLLGPNGRRVPGFGAAVAHLAATGGAGILLHRSVDDAGRPVQTILNAVVVDGAVILLDPRTLAPAMVPTGRPVDVLLLPTSAGVPESGIEPVDPDAAWAPTFAELFPPVPLILPPGTAEIDGGALLVGAHATDHPSRTAIVELTVGLRSPVVILDAPVTDANLTTLGALLERLRLQGRLPVVVHPATLTPALRDLGTAHGVALVHKASPAGSLTVPRLGNVWAATGPGRTPALYGEQPTRQVFEAAATMTALLSQPAPATLGEWLNTAAAADWSESQRLLDDQLGDLTQPAVRAWLDGMTARAAPGDNTAAIHAALLDLAGLRAAHHGYEFLAASGPAARMEAALKPPVAVLHGVLEPLVRLAQGTAEGPVDQADAAVLEALRHILTTDSPTPKVFDRERIRHLSEDERIKWTDRLREIGAAFDDGSAQKAALAELRTMTLNC
ncbi:hypothetical protein ACQEVZ_39815 [Dactylosporangium sp. CA-152071]|uniref:hypothetical protein n=1 Tax=Dactylosporangium sp. CA-152071 TaxID=3239933 RepID=UPI003D91A1CF